MKSMVVYDSEFGNTRELAVAIAGQLEADGSVQIESVREEQPPVLPDDLKLLVIGGPTQVHRVSPLLRKWLDAIPSYSLDGVEAAAFDTRIPGARWLTGAASKGIAKALRRTGATLVAPPESFVVQGREGPLAEGELQRGRAWAANIISHTNTRSVALTS